MAGAHVLPEGPPLHCSPRSRFETDTQFALMRAVRLPFAMKCLRPCHYVVRESVKPSPTVFYMRRHYPLAGRMDATVLQLQAAGILDHWRQWHLSQFQPPQRHEVRRSGRSGRSSRAA